MNAKHTPGPWTVIGTEVRWLTDDETVTKITDHETMTPRQAANAALVAAAPAMLEALQTAVDSYKPMYMSGTEWVYPEWHKQARAAINKATGA